MKKLVFLITINLSLIFSICGQSELTKIKDKDYNSGILKTFYVNEQNLKEGGFIYSYQKQKQAFGQYSNNLRTGTWTFMPSINFKIIGNYTDGLKNGKWVFLQNYDTVSILNYVDDTLNGTQFGFYQTGKIKSELNYEMGIIDGNEISYHENGQIKEIRNIKNGKLNGNHIIYNNNGDTISCLQFHNGTPINLEIYNKKSEMLFFYGNLKNGTGDLITYILNHETNTKHLYLKRHYQDSLIAGMVFRFNYQGTTVLIGQFENGYMNGTWQFFDEDGTLLDSKEYSSSDKYIYDSTIFNTRIDEQKIFSVEKFPKFQGYDNDLELRKFLANNLQFPEECKRNKIQGRIFVKFSVTREGEVINSKIVNKIDPLMDTEAIRLVNSIPYFVPAFQSGIPVQVEYIVPVNFVLF